MPTITDYELIDGTFLNPDSVRSPRSILRADYGEGFADTARVGALGGQKRFNLSAGVWPDREDQPQISGDTIFDYYWNFFETRLDNGNEPFRVEVVGRQWLVDLAEPEHGVDIHTSDLFTPHGITVNMRRVAGLTHARDGSLFDPSLIASSIWGRYKDAQDFPASLPFPYLNPWEDSLNSHHLGLAVNDVVSAADVLGTYDAVRFSATTNDGVLESTETVTIYEAFFVMQMREATFSNTCGILTGDAGGSNIALAGQSGTTKFFNLGLGSANYQYKLNNVAYAESDQQAPMNDFGVVHIRFPNGRLITNLQVGKDRADGTRHAEMDQIEMVFCDSPLDDLDAEAFSRYLMTFYSIP